MADEKSEVVRQQLAENGRKIATPTYVSPTTANSQASCFGQQKLNWDRGFLPVRISSFPCAIRNRAQLTREAPYGSIYGTGFPDPFRAIKVQVLSFDQVRLHRAAEQFLAAK
jgi:hypothetical protein